LGSSVDDAIVSYIATHKGIVATVDIDLKKRIRNFGGSILSLANDRIVLESSKI
jgi:rRNA-processing protein FCF1